MGLHELKQQVATVKEIYYSEKSKRKTYEEMARRTKYVELYKKNKVQSNVIIYEAYMGRGMICNPYAIFKAFLMRPDFNRFEHYWSLDVMDDSDAEYLMNKYKKYANVHFVGIHTDEYLDILTKAKYLINNVTFPAFYTKKEEQIYINTWHGIPLKTLGYDLPDGNTEVKNTIRNFLSVDYLISPSEFMTEIYKKSFRLDGIFQGKIIEEGQPRNDNLFNTSKHEIVKQLVDHGVKIDPSKKIVMYAPTWKGGDYGNPDVGLECYFDFIQTMEEKIDTEQYQVLVKPHQVVYKYIKNNAEVTNQFIPATIDTNEILSIVDILVSDYSSIYFDFLATKRPILFYIPDLEEYKEYRGLYGSIDDLPGPSTKNIKDIAEWIQDIDHVMVLTKDKYDEKRQWACSKDDGHVIKRIFEIVFEKKNQQYKVIDNFVSTKKRILIYASFLKPNGITQSLYSLLNTIDYDKFDVTVFGVLIKGSNEAAFNSINKKARVLVRPATYNATLDEDVRLKVLYQSGIKGLIEEKMIPKNLFKRECRRLFGDATFDYAVEFNGYSTFYGMLFLFVNCTKKFIWQHNDLLKDRFREIDGQTPNDLTLKFVFSLYPYYDKLVSCSHAVMLENKKSLATPKTNNKFTYARNTVNYERIEKALKEPCFINVEGKEYYLKQINENINDLQYNMDVLKLPSKDGVIFVTMGRLSPEKNHSNLLKAFAKLYKEYSKVRLYILGDGPLYNKLTKEIDALGLKDKAILTGNLGNPFGFLKIADCFVLPSNYEGQPMVIQETRVLEKPIVMSDFSTGKDAYIDGGQLVVKKDVDSLYEGLLAFMNGKVPKYHFDAHEYNQMVYKEFEKLFD